MTKTTYKYLRSSLIKRREKHEKWKDIGKDYPDVPLGTLCRIARDETYMPKSPILRAHLGLEPLPVSVTPCSKCGQLHAFSRRCPGASSKYHPHPVMRLSRIKAILNSPYRDS